MKIISLLSSHTDTGQTTVAVNLSVGLCNKGLKVLVCNLNSNMKLYHWLGIELNQVKSVNLYPDLQEIMDHIYQSDLGIDVLYLGSHPEATIFESDYVLDMIQNLNYDYLILNPGERKEDLMIAAQLADNVIACTDLKHEDETCRLEKLQKELEV
ncbi:MAG: hypothetical protein U9N81_07640, partial [Bacillota bacterium]|nr:hypothetical protein [Bacillota bacterium]